MSATTPMPLYRTHATLTKKSDYAPMICAYESLPTCLSLRRYGARKLSWGWVDDTCTRFSPFYHGRALPSATALIRWILARKKMRLMKRYFARDAYLI